LSAGSHPPSGQQQQCLVASQQSSEYNRDEPADGGFGPQVAGCREGADAVVGELVRRDIGPDCTGVNGLDEQVSNDLGEPLLWSGYVLASMDQRSELCPVLVPLKRDQRVRLKNGFKSRSGFARLVAEPGQVFQVVGDMPFMPGDQDWFDTCEVFA
jgi:hypothetical protein